MRAPAGTSPRADPPSPGCRGKHARERGSDARRGGRRRRRRAGCRGGRRVAPGSPPWRRRYQGQSSLAPAARDRRQGPSASSLRCRSQDQGRPASRGTAAANGRANGSAGWCRRRPERPYRRCERRRAGAVAPLMRGFQASKNLPSRCWRASATSSVRPIGSAKARRAWNSRRRQTGGQRLVQAA